MHVDQVVGAVAGPAGGGVGIPGEHAVFHGGDDSFVVDAGHGVHGGLDETSEVVGGLLLASGAPHVDLEAGDVEVLADRRGTTDADNPDNRRVGVSGDLGADPGVEVGELVD